MLTMNEMIAGGLISAFFTFLALQVYAMITPSRPKALIPIILAVSTGIGGMTLVYVLWGSMWSLMVACVAGVYGWGGWVYCVGFFLIVSVFLLNTMFAWSKNKPIDLTL